MSPSSSFNENFSEKLSEKQDGKHDKNTRPSHERDVPSVGRKIIAWACQPTTLSAFSLVIGALMGRWTGVLGEPASLTMLSMSLPLLFPENRMAQQVGMAIGTAALHRLGPPAPPTAKLPLSTPQVKDPSLLQDRSALSAQEALPPKETPPKETEERNSPF